MSADHLHDGNGCGHHPEWCDDAGVCGHPDGAHELGACGDFCQSCLTPWTMA